MRTLTGYKIATGFAIIVAVTNLASAAQAQISLQTNVSGSVVGGASNNVKVDTNISAHARIKTSTTTTPNASATGTMHANENSAVIRGNEPQGNADATASSTAGVSHKIHARFLGIFPAEITAQSVTQADGTVTVKYPWYAFLFNLKVVADTSASVR